MKKVLSVSLAVILLLASLSFSAFAADTTKTEALFARLESANEVSVTLRAGDVNLFGFLPASATDTVYIKGNKVAYEYSLGIISARAIYNGEDIYGLIPELPFFYVKLDGDALGTPDVWSLINGAGDITMGVLRFKKSYNETVGSTEYFVEEFDDRAQVTSKFYYLGDDLKMLDVYDAQNGSTQITYFEKISFSVSDSVFEIPASAFDLTVILKSLVASLLQ